MKTAALLLPLLAACSSSALPLDAGADPPYTSTPLGPIVASCVDPDNAPACGSGGICDCDDDHYCLASACELDGCLRGWCTLTRVQGEACDRNRVCASGPCVAGVCTAGDGGVWVHVGDAGG